MLGKRYKIWKKSVDEYRILDVHTGETSVKKHFIAENALFKVDDQGYLRAKHKGFENDPNKEDDYFAWIEADFINENPKHWQFGDKVFYNPFKDPYFRDRQTGERVNEAEYVFINGNLLSYTR